VGPFDYDLAGFPEPRLTIKPDHQEHFFCFGEWQQFTLRVYDRNNDAKDCVRFATPVCTENGACYTLVVGRIIERMFMEKKTYRNWVTLQRIGTGLATQYRLTSGDRVSSRSLERLVEHSHEVEWTPYAEFKTIQELRMR
jgi:hypothetical protein